MPVVRLRVWDLKPGTEKQARQELDKLSTIRREAPGYFCCMEWVAPHNPSIIAIVSVWKDKECADAFAQTNHTMSHLAAMRRWADEGSLTGDVYDAQMDCQIYQSKQR